MSAHHLSGMLRHVRRLLGDRPDEVADGTLLERFARHADDTAFATLVRRHGPLVWSVSRRVAGHEQDGEDVYQATFLLLAGKAGSIRKRNAVGSWLYGVAYRLALRARCDAARRRQREARVACSATVTSCDNLTWRELRETLDAELARLPDKYRAPLLLCYFEGLTQEEAARQLGWSKRSVKDRLERGRNRLRVRLSRRGITLSMTLAGSLLAGDASKAAVSAALSEMTLRGAVAFARHRPLGGLVSSSVLDITERGLKTMFVGKLLIATTLVLVTAALGGVGVLLDHLGAAKQQEQTSGDGPKPAAKRDGFPAAGETRQARTDLHGDPLPPRALARMGTIRFRHGENVEGIAVSPDGRTVASASRDETVRLWDVAAGRELRRFPDHKGTLRFIAFSPDGTLLASGVSPSGIVRLWDPATGKEMRQLQSPFPLPWLGHLAFSPDGKIVAGGGARHRIVLWETATGRLLHQLDGHEESPFAVALAFSPDRRMLASGGQGETLRLWNLTTGKEERRFLIQPPWPKEKSAPPNYRGLVEAIAFSPDGRTLTSAAKDSPIRIWDVATGKEIRALQGDRFGAFSLAFTRDGKTLVSGEALGAVRVWEAATGKEVRRFQAHRACVSGLAFSCDGQTLLTSGDSVIHQWEIGSGAEIHPERGHSARITSSALLPDQRTLITGSPDGTIRHWDRATGKELHRLTAPSGSHRGMVLSPDGKIVACFKDQIVRENISEVGVVLWDIAAQRERALLWRPNIFGAIFSPDGKNLFTQAWDLKEKAGVIRLWDVATGKELRVLAQAGDGFDATELSPDGKALAAVVRGPESAIHVWDVATGQLLRRVPADREFNQSLQFSPDSKLLAVADGPRPMLDSRVLHHHIRLWDIATRKELRQFARSSSGLWAMTFSADGKTLATAGQDNRIRLWEVATGGERLRLEGHAGWVQGLMFAENGRTLISTSNDTTALVWDVTGLRKDERLPVSHLSARELEGRWATLVGDDAARAYQAIWDLAAASHEAMQYLSQHLKPVPAVGADRLARLIGDLDSNAFVTREKAGRELESLDTVAEAALRLTLKKQPSLEVRRRIDQLLAKLEGKTVCGEWVRGLRALEVLEYISTPEARQVLQDLSRGASEARLTREAKAALERLAKPSPKG